MDILQDTLDRTSNHEMKTYVAEYEGTPPSSTSQSKIAVEITAEKVQDAALRFARNSRVTVLNFASGVNPGGSVRFAARAQEEVLCLTTGLLHSLESQPSFYAANRSKEAPAECYDRMIVSQHVPVIKDGDFRLVEDPPLINILTYPAPNTFRGVFGEWGDSTFHPEDKGPDLAQSDIQEIFERRCSHVVHQANELGTEVLILGPWGCGQYGNDPQIVATAFRDAIARCGETFDYVVFACYGDATNRKVFSEVFNQNSSSRAE